VFSRYEVGGDYRGMTASRVGPAEPIDFTL
jgi:hypothetical protein